ncbi:MAG TPA: SUF system NifU family Fe-S cluster assembly protein [Acidisarcina sp.]|nr:SUF system NifU family Fe-S cluster assembly protein [Acidisarcina sp.]
MSELQDLYQDVILEHSKHPRNFRAMKTANRKAEGYNPLCGDHYTVFVEMDDDTIRDVSFQGSGCAISKASASIMSQALKSKTAAEAEDLFHKFHEVVTGQDRDSVESLGKLAAFAGVAEFPTRVKCATLAWHTLQAALKEKQIASTE